MERGDKVKVKKTGWIGEVVATGRLFVKVIFDEDKDLKEGNAGYWRPKHLEEIE